MKLFEYLKALCLKSGVMVDNDHPFFRVCMFVSVGDLSADIDINIRGEGVNAVKPPLIFIESSSKNLFTVEWESFNENMNWHFTEVKKGLMIINNDVIGLMLITSYLFLCLIPPLIFRADTCAHDATND